MSVHHIATLPVDQMERDRIILPLTDEPPERPVLSPSVPAPWHIK